jgi:hypothetical protein
MRPVILARYDRDSAKISRRFIPIAESLWLLRCMSLLLAQAV